MPLPNHIARLFIVQAFLKKKKKINLLEVFWPGRPVGTLLLPLSQEYQESVLNCREECHCCSCLKATSSISFFAFKGTLFPWLTENRLLTCFLGFFFKVSIMEKQNKVLIFYQSKQLKVRSLKKNQHFYFIWLDCIQNKHKRQRLRLALASCELSPQIQ